MTSFRRSAPGVRARRRIASLIVGLAATAAAASALAFTVYGAIGAKWNELGGAQGVLGPALNDESPGSSGGRYNAFRNGFIFWRADLGAHAVYGAIGRKWSELGRDAGFGYPITDEQPAADGGRFNDFENGGSIYWRSDTGAQAVVGAIRARWNELGRERGALGYPVTSELPGPDNGRHSDFQKGVIFWKAATGAHAVYGRIGEKWLATGGAGGPCGYPIGDEQDGPSYLVPGGSTPTRISHFEHGAITWYAHGDVTSAQCSPALPPGSRLRNCPARSSDPRCRHP